MFIVTITIAILLGLLGAAQLIVGQKPEAKAFIDKISPFAGLIGIAGLLLGIIGLLNSLRYFSLLGLLLSACMTLLGLIYGLDLIKQSAKVDALENLATKVDPWKGIMGAVLLVFSILQLIRYLLA